MEYYNNTLAVNASWLIEVGIISKPNYDQLKSRGKVNVLRRGCLNTPALVEYESIPERFKKAIVEKVGNPYKAVANNQIEEHITNDAELVDFYTSYKLADGRFLPIETRKEYIANAQVLKSVQTIITNQKTKRAALGKRATRNWEVICEAVQEVDRSKWPHSLPANPRRLEDRYKRFVNEGYESLIHKNFLNSNAAKVDEDVKESVIIELISDPRNYDNAQIMRVYNQMCEALGWKKITAAAVAVWRDKYDTMIFARRHGATKFRNEKAMQVKRSAPTFPLYMWTMDGWDVELFYQEKGKTATTYHNRPTVVVVLDACCKYPVGYAIGTHETPDLIKEALRNAAKHTESLFGQMYRVNQLQSDHYAIKKMTSTYELIADKFTPARVKNAKAKIIEPYFMHINKTYCQMQPNWSGFGVKAKNQPNMELLQKYRHNYPDFEGVCAQIIAIIERERREKIDKYMELWGLTPTENKLLLPYDQYLLHFGSTTGHRNLLQGSGLKLTIGGVKRDYDCFEHDFRRHSAVKWEVRYDPDELQRVLAVNEDESLRFILEEKYVQPMALVERKLGDYEQLQRVVRFNEEQEQQVAGFLGTHQENVQALIEENRNRLTEQTLSKFLITDSKGQHKDRKSEARTAKKEITEAVFTPVENEDNLFDEY